MIKTEILGNGAGAAHGIMSPVIIDAQKNLTAVNPSVLRGKKTSENDYYKVICPFFQDLSGHTIRCEGIIPDTKSVTSFGNIRRMKKYRRVFCNTFSYENCELCKALMKKYE